MKRVVALGLVVATVAIGFAVAGERLSIGRLLDSLRDGQRLPALRSQELPFRYPVRLWREGVEGEVLLKVHITAVGTVDSVEIELSSGHAELDSIALNGAWELRYHPATEGEQPVAVWATLPVRFERSTEGGMSEYR
ncbi:MAG: energy transducer TonB [Gemmatimonadota bacterium]|nr:MAG: energy transducer TonB [Gemmatimonadota bacterium]